MLASFPILALLVASSFHEVVTAIGPPSLIGKTQTQTESPKSEHHMKLHRVDLPVDHFADCSDTYSNRYWVSDYYYKPGGPVFIYDVGEVSGEGDTPEDYFWNLLQEFSALGIKWEHRYYGKSLPQHHGREYLTIEQALADLPTMAANFSLAKYPDQDLTPASTPWIFTGGSYPGARAAWSRARYPNTFFAAWAASAPVEIRFDHSVYYLPILDGMKAFGLGDCLSDLQAGQKKIDEILVHSDKSKSDRLKEKFIKNGANTTNGEFGYILSLAFSNWQSYLEKYGVKQYCDKVETDPKTNETAPAGGWAPIKGADWVVDRMASYKFPDWKTVDGFVQSRAAKSWIWQSYTEFGLYPTYGKELDHFISRYFDHSWYAVYSRKSVPQLTDIGRPRVRHHLNKEFGGWNMHLSNTFWTTGEYDPWRSFQVMSNLSDAPKRTPTLAIPKCGVVPPEDKLFGYLMKNAAHMFEFSRGKQARRVQAVFANAVHAWLPCFEKSTKKKITPSIPPRCNPRSS